MSRSVELSPQSRRPSLLNSSRSCCAASTSGMRTMGRLQTLLGGACLLISAVAASMTAAAQGRGPCAQIKEACQDAGFVQGAAREGIGLQIHCVAPIIQGTTQPPTARRPLPKIDPQLVEGCRARSARFAPGSASQALAQPVPAGPSASTLEPV